MAPGQSSQGSTSSSPGLQEAGLEAVVRLLDLVRLTTGHVPSTATADQTMPRQTANAP